MKNKSFNVSDESLKNATGKSWDEWFKVLKDENLENLAHKEIATWLTEKQHISGWWAQTITVGFEQSIGRREIGQKSDGTYSISVTKTLNGDMNEAFNQWLNKVKSLSSFNKVKFAEEPTISVTNKWKYWRVNLIDGTKINSGIYQKEPEKSIFGIEHEKLTSKEVGEKWKTFWKEFFKDL